MPLSVFLCCSSLTWTTSTARRGFFLSPSFALLRVVIGWCALYCQTKIPPQPSLQFSKQHEAKLREKRAAVCYFCKGDADDPDSLHGAFVRVSPPPPPPPPQLHTHTVRTPPGNTARGRKDGHNAERSPRRPVFAEGCWRPRARPKTRASPLSLRVRSRQVFASLATLLSLSPPPPPLNALDSSVRCAFIQSSADHPITRFAS